MSLGAKQERWTEMWALLIQYANFLGYKIRTGDTFRDARVHGKYGEKKSYAAASSVHKLKLAGDANVTLDGVYLEGKAAHNAHSELHDFWDLLGGAPRIKHDMNHYSLPHEGHW